MLRRTFRALGRPKGPPGQRPGREYRLVVPYRSEITMIRQCGTKQFNANIRELFKKPLEQNNIKAIPRDLGELPRNFVVRVLFAHQPIRLVDLWDVCKQREDVPLDSAKHLRLVLKIAKLQKWVYAEKNQTDNFYYYYIDRSRVHEVQRMVREDEVRRRREESETAAAAEQESEEKESLARDALDVSIAAMQQKLISNLVALRSYEPEFVDNHPCVTPSGAVNCAWYRADASPSSHADDEHPLSDSAKEVA